MKYKLVILYEKNEVHDTSDYRHGGVSRPVYTDNGIWNDIFQVVTQRLIWAENEHATSFTPAPLPTYRKLNSMVP